jgi:AcrR family transcriptional regulator
VARKTPRVFTSAPPPPETGARARTWRQLIDNGMRLVQSQGLVSVADVATAAGVSRATAYRYFPSRSRLVTAVVEESLGPVRRFESRQTDGRARLRDLFDQTFPRFKVFEAQLRAALQLALEHWAKERASVLTEEPFRRGHRTNILDRAAAPLRAQLGAARYDRLLKALSVVYGIEPYIVLKDIWGLSDREVEAVARWMLDALIDAALRDARAAAPRPAPPRAAGGRAVRERGPAAAGSTRARPNSARSR